MTRPLTLTLVAVLLIGCGESGPDPLPAVPECEDPENYTWDPQLRTCMEDGPPGWLAFGDTLFYDGRLVMIVSEYEPGGVPNSDDDQWNDLEEFIFGTNPFEYTDPDGSPTTF